MRYKIRLAKYKAQDTRPPASPCLHFKSCILTPRAAEARGFTLIELMVAVALFAVVMIISITSLTSVINADRKAQSVQSAVNSLDFALDDLVRTVRTGTDFHCSALGSYSNVSQPSGDNDCFPYNSSPYLAVLAHQGDDAGNTVVYQWSANCDGRADYVVNGVAHGCIEKSNDAAAPNSFKPLTPPDVSVDDMQVFMTGSASADGLQPRAFILVTAHVNLVNGGKTTLHLQTSITQRVYDAT